MAELQAMIRAVWNALLLTFQWFYGAMLGPHDTHSIRILLHGQGYVICDPCIGAFIRDVDPLDVREHCRERWCDFYQHSFGDGCARHRRGG